MSEIKVLHYVEPQCQHFVARKKRLCRMTVRPGRSYCGEHEPKPVAADAEDDTRIRCPYDSKHTCYSSKLERHLTVCNARPAPPPEYIQKNINAPSSGVPYERKPLSQVPMDAVLRVVDKVHRLYEAHISPSLTSYRTRPIHPVVVPEFTERGRTEASLRHLRQASSLLHIAEDEGLVRGDTCYVELGAGKGQLSLFAWRAWCEPSEGGVLAPGAAGSSGVLLVDRAALRHKRDAKIRAGTHATHSAEALGRWCRVRADLADVSLRRVALCRSRRLVGLAKHLCGAATDLALRSLVQSSAEGAVLATCCHHRCELHTYTGTSYLMELGLSPEEQSVMLGIVSWATCGDGRARTRTDQAPAHSHTAGSGGRAHCSDQLADKYQQLANRDTFIDDGNCKHQVDNIFSRNLQTAKHDELESDTGKYEKSYKEENTFTEQLHETGDYGEQTKPHETRDSGEQTKPHETVDNGEQTKPHETGDNGEQTSKVSNEDRETAGRRAKALLDWGRVLYLRGHGFDARLCHFVPASVSLENVCIVAHKINFSF